MEEIKSEIATRMNFDEITGSFNTDKTVTRNLRHQSSLAVVGEPRQDFAVSSALLIPQDDPILRLVEMLQQQHLELIAPSQKVMN